MYRYYCVCVCIINIFGHCPQDIVNGGEILLCNVMFGDASFSGAYRLLKIPPSVCVCMAQRGGCLTDFHGILFY